MRNIKTWLCLLLACVLAFSAFAFSGCADGTKEEPVKLSYTATDLADATAGVAYSASVATATGAENITYALKAGSSLPKGLTLSEAGSISGTPEAAVEAAKFTVTASAAGAESADAQFTLTVKEAPVVPEIAYTGSTLPDGTVGTAYSTSVATATGAENITYALKAGSSLPKGLTLSEAGSISGTPEAAVEVAKFTVTASAAGAESADAQFTLTIKEAPAVPEISFEATSLPEGTVGENYIASVATATGAARIKYALKAGSSLPKGLTLSETGSISGTPEAAVDAAKFTVTASAEGAESVDAEFVITIKEAPVPEIAYTGSTLPDGTVGTAYSTSVATATGAENITYALKAGSSLPKGLTLSEEGSISGTPEAAVEAAKFTVTASAVGAESAEAQFTLTIKEKPVVPEIVYVSTSLPDGTVGTAYSASVATATGAEGITYALKAGNELPEGLALSADGTISGTPEVAAANAKFTVTASAEGAESADAQFTLVIKEKVITFSDTYRIEGEWGYSGDAVPNAEFAENINNASGKGFVDFKADKTENNDVSSVLFKFNAKESGPAILSVCLGLNSGEYTLDQVYTIKVNGQVFACTAEVPSTTHDTWHDWTEIQVGTVGLVAEENTIEIIGGDPALCLDYIVLKVPAEQEIVLEDCTAVYSGDPVEVPLEMSNADLSDLAAAFGEGYTVSAIYDMNRFYGGVLGTEDSEWTAITDAVGQQPLGANVWKVTAQKDGTSATMIIPVELTTNIVRLEGEWTLGSEGSAAKYGPGRNGSSGTGYVDLVAKDNTVIFSFNAAKAGRANLIASLGLRTTEPFTFASAYVLKVNGTPVEPNVMIPSKSAAGTDWFDWTEIVLGEIELKAGPNTIEFTGAGNQLNIDYISLVLPSDQSVHIYDCTDEYAGEEVDVVAIVESQGSSIIVSDVDLSALEAVFGSGYEVTAVYNMDQFYNGVLGTALTDISGALKDVSFGNYTWKVTASNGSDTKTMIVPIAVTPNMEVKTYEAEAESVVRADGVTAEGKTEAPTVANGNGRSGIDFHGANGTLTFTINVEKETDEALLFVCAGRSGNTPVAISDVYEITVNSTVLESDAILPPMSGGQAWYDWYDLNVGTISLQAGNNTIVVKGVSPLILDSISVWIPV